MNAKLDALVREIFVIIDTYYDKKDAEKIAEAINTYFSCDHQAEAPIETSLPQMFE